MKVSLEKNNAAQNQQNVSFKGYKPVKSDLGHLEYEFNYTFDDKQYDCYLELCAVEDAGNGNYTNKRALKNFDTNSNSYKMTCGANKIDLTGSYNLSSDTPFAYHYRLTPKNQPEKTYQYDVDAGDIMDFRNEGGDHLIYNLVIPNRTRGTKGGSGILAIPDSYNAMYAFNKDGRIVLNYDYANAVNKTKHFSNKVGGNFAGLIYDIKTGKLGPYSKVFLTPFATDDSLTPHSYWNKNCFQTAHSLGNIDNYIALQKALFVNDSSLVSDAALVNEGLEGIHFNHVLKWGKKSYAYNWFRADLDQGPFGLGVLSKNKKFISHKVINSPYIFSQDSSGKVTWKKASKWDGHGEQGNKYDPKSPTYIQMIDTDLATENEKKDTSKRQKIYSKSDTGNPYEKVTHNDTVILYSHEIDPETYLDNVKRLNDYNASRPKGEFLPMNSCEATRILSKFRFFNYEGKFEGGKEDWDANVDVAKLNYSFSNYNSKYMKEHIPVEQREAYKNLVLQKNTEVQDYAITSAQYWTKKTSQALNLHVAQSLKNVKSDNAQNIMDLIRLKVVNKSLPASVELAIDNQTVQNMLDGHYKLHGMDTVESFKNVTLANMMELPLDSIEFGDNLAAVFASPYMTKRATHADEIGMSRFELHKKGNPHLTDEYKRAYEKMDNLYTHEMNDFAQDILKRVDKKLSPKQRLYSDVNTSPYGKYVLPLVAPEIAKFAIVKGLFPDADVKVKPDGGISYDYNKLKETSIQALEIYPKSPEDEAVSVINRLKGYDLKHKGIPAISEEDKELLANAISKMLEGTNLTSFKLAEMIVDRTQAGLDWRIDAAKDIADKESLLSKQTTFEKSWNQVTKFWKDFAQTIYKENPNSYVVVELTDLDKLYNAGEGKFSDKYYPRNFNDMETSSKDIVMKFLRETGITATANYDYFFTDIPGIFSKSYEEYEDRGVFQGTKVFELLKKNGKDFLHSGPLDSILYSYNFVDNHDKPRALHMMALNSELFYANLNVNTYDKDVNSKEYKQKETAYRVLNNKFYDHFDKSEVDGFNFMKKSTKAVAMGDALNTAFGRALERLQEKNTINDSQKTYYYQCIAHAISDLANGNYLDKNFEADAFGTRPFDITIETVLKQAKGKYNLSIDENSERDLKKTAFYMSIDPAISKLLGIMKFLVAVPGIPTMYAGDDIGSTGYEELTRNIFLQNRSVIHHEWLEDNEDWSMGFIKDHKAEFENIMGLRRRPELHALNDGAPVLLPLQGGKFYQDNQEIKIELPALLRQSTDGTMAVSIFNTVGVSHDYDKYNDPGKFPVYIGGINLDYDKNEATGLKAGLPDGTVFVNAANENDKYVVKREGNHYYIAHENGDPIELKDNTLNLYHVPLHVQKEFDRLAQIKAAIVQPRPKVDKPFKMIKQKVADKTAFSGNSRRLYNPQYNFVSNPYSQKQKADEGSKLSLLAR